MPRKRSGIEPAPSPKSFVFELTRDGKLRRGELARFERFLKREHATAVVAWSLLRSVQWKLGQHSLYTEAVLEKSQELRNAESQKRNDDGVRTQQAQSGTVAGRPSDSD